MDWNVGRPGWFLDMINYLSDLLVVNFSDSPIGIPCKSVCCLLAGEGIILVPVVQHSDVGVGRDKQVIMDSEHEPTVAL